MSLVPDCMSSTDFLGNNLKDSHNLIIIEIQKGKYICYTRDELRRILYAHDSDPNNNRALRVQPDAKTVIQELDEKSPTVHDKWLYILKNKKYWFYKDLYTNLYIDHTLRDLFEEHVNTMILKKREGKTMVEQNLGVSGVHDVLADIYYVEKLRRCDLYEAMIEFKGKDCKERDDFDEEGGENEFEEEKPVEEDEEEKKKINDMAGLMKEQMEKRRQAQAIGIEQHELVISDLSIAELPPLQEGLLKLDCSGCGMLTHIHDLPDSLLELNCSYCTSLVLIDLPDKLQKLHCIQCTSLEAVSELPENMTEFLCSGSTLPVLPVLPAGLTFLDCSDCKIDSLAELPASLTELNCAGCPINSIPNLPAGLIGLYCSQCTEIKNLPDLPYGLRELDISGTQLTQINLVDSIQALRCSDCQYLENISHLPDDLIALVCNGCFSLEFLPPLPNNLEILSCYNCNELKEIPPLPAQLEVFNCSGCLIRNLPVLPPLLTNLDCSMCPYITSIKKIPKNLEILFCNDCPLLKSISKLPDTLQEINFSNCPTLRNPPEVPEGTYTAGEYVED